MSAVSRCCSAPTDYMLDKLVEIRIPLFNAERNWKPVLRALPSIVHVPLTLIHAVVALAVLTIFGTLSLATCCKVKCLKDRVAKPIDNLKYMPGNLLESIINIVSCGLCCWQ